MLMWMLLLYALSIKWYSQFEQLEYEQETNVHSPITSTTWSWSFFFRAFRVAVRGSWLSFINVRFCFVSWEKESHIVPYSSVDTTKGLQETWINFMSLKCCTSNTSTTYLTWWSWLKGLYMKTAMTETSQQAAGKIPSRPPRREPQASSQLENTGPLLHCSLSPPPLDYHIGRIPKNKQYNEATSL